MCNNNISVHFYEALHSFVLNMFVIWRTRQSSLHSAQPRVYFIYNIYVSRDWLAVLYLYLLGSTLTVFLCCFWIFNAKWMVHPSHFTRFQLRFNKKECSSFFSMEMEVRTLDSCLARRQRKIVYTILIFDAQFQCTMYGSVEGCKNSKNPYAIQEANDGRKRSQST